MTVNLLLSLAVAGSLTGLLVLIAATRHRQVREEQLENKRIRALQLKINAVLQDELHDLSLDALNTTLKTARLTTGFQVPRLQNLARIDKQPPEKYRILGKLASQGMGTEEIAAVLDISTVEAAQLLHLNAMARTNG
jgi:hypothetical protein